MMPSAPSATAFTSGEFGSMVMTNSDLFGDLFRGVGDGRSGGGELGGRCLVV